MSDWTYILRIGGVVDDSGEQIAYTTRPLAYTSPPTQSSAIREIPSSVQQSLGVLEPLGASGGITLGLIYGAQYVDRICRQQIVPVTTSSGLIVRMTRPIRSSTTIYVTGEPDLSSGDLLYIGGEAMEYGSYTGLVSGWAAGLGYMTVSRGVAGTYVTAAGVAGVGTVLMRQLSTVTGQPASLHRVPASATSSSAEELVYRGYIDGWRPSGPTVSVSLVSGMSRLRDRQYVPTASASFESAVDLSWTLGDAGITPASGLSLASVQLDVLPEDTTSPPLLWLTMTRDGVEAEVLVTGVWYEDVGDYLSYRIGIDSDSSALLMRIGGRDLSVSDAARLLASTWQVTRAQVADQLASTATSLGTIVHNLVRGSELGPVGRRGMLPNDYIALDLVLVLDAATGVESVSTPCYDGSERFVLPPADKPRPFRELLGDLLRPWAVSLIPRSDGRITAVDWLEPRDAIGSLTDENDARGPWTDLEVDSIAAIRAVTLSAQGDGERIERTIISDVAMQTSQGGEHVTVDASAWGPLWPALYARWFGVLSTYQQGTPIARVLVSDALDIDIGDWRSLDAATLAGPSGTRGISGVSCVVIGRSQRLDAPVAELTLALVGWGTTGNARRWAPALRVASVSNGGGSDVVTAADYFDADEAGWFSVGDFVLLYDTVGNAVDATPREVTAVGSGTITCDQFSTAPVAGDLIVLADYDDTVRRGWCWQADTAGRLGAAGDPGHTWR